MAFPPLLFSFLLADHCVADVYARRLLGFQYLLLLLYQVVVANFVSVHLYVSLPHDLPHRFGLRLLPDVVEAKSLLLINSADVLFHLLSLGHSLRCSRSGGHQIDFRRLLSSCFIRSSTRSALGLFSSGESVAHEVVGSVLVFVGLVASTCALGHRAAFLDLRPPSR